MAETTDWLICEEPSWRVPYHNVRVPCRYLWSWLEILELSFCLFLFSLRSQEFLQWKSLFQNLTFYPGNSITSLAVRKFFTFSVVKEHKYIFKPWQKSYMHTSIYIQYTYIYVALWLLYSFVHSYTDVDMFVLLMNNGSWSINMFNK